MRTYGNELIVHRNETITIDKYVKNKDASPYIVSNKLRNPYLLLTVSNARYAQKDRYVGNWWLDLGNLPRFSTTVPTEILDVTVWPSALPSGYAFDQNSPEAPVKGSGGETLYYLIDTVFYITDSNNIVEYKYATATRTGESGSYIYTFYGYTDYSFRIIKTFSQEETRDWIEKLYIYSINLVSGELTSTYLQELADELGITYADVITNEELYELLVAADVEFDDDFDANRILLPPFNVSVPILVPTNVTVLSDLNGGM